MWKLRRYAYYMLQYIYFACMLVYSETGPPGWPVVVDRTYPDGNEDIYGFLSVVAVIAMLFQ